MSTSDLPVLHVQGPGDLLDAVPYLLGFHPRDSLVLIGLAGDRVSVTGRIDLGQCAEPGLLRHTAALMHNARTEQIVVAVFADGGGHAERAPGEALPYATMVDALADDLRDVGFEVRDMLLVSGRSWWSYLCFEPGCCPPEGNALAGESSATAAAATYAGLVALPDRMELTELLRPADEATCTRMAPKLAEAENDIVRAVLCDRGEQADRTVKRAIFAAARQADTAFGARHTPLSDAQVARFAVALTDVRIRDALWVAVDARRLDGRKLWQELAGRVPAPYDAPPLFLFGWSSWRDGHGPLADIAARRALGSDDGYTAAHLLQSALEHGLDPRRTPRLRMPRVRAPHSGRAGPSVPGPIEPGSAAAAGSRGGRHSATA